MTAPRAGLTTETSQRKAADAAETAARKDLHTLHLLESGTVPESAYHASYKLPLGYLDWTA